MTDTLFHQRLGQAVRTRRTERGKTQSELGRAIGVTFQQVRKLEHGINRISVQALVKIVSFLGCTVSDIIADTDAPEWPAIVSPDPLMLETAQALRGLSHEHLQAVISLIKSLKEGAA